MFMENSKAILIPGRIGSPGIPRRASIKDLKNYNAAVSLLDEAMLDAIEVLKKGLRSNNPYVRIASAKEILKKTIPDRQRKEHTGDGGGPIVLERTDRRIAVLAVVDALDELEISEIKHRIDNGNQRILELTGQGEGQTEGENQEADRYPGSRNLESESLESPDDFEGDEGEDD